MHFNFWVKYSFKYTSRIC